MGRPGNRPPTYAIAHLSESYECGEQNSPRRAPRMSRIDALAAEYRQSGYQEGSHRVNTTHPHHTKSEYEFRPLARHVAE